jgi:hypothetical protein
MTYCFFCEMAKSVESPQISPESPHLCGVSGDIATSHLFELIRCMIYHFLHRTCFAAHIEAPHFSFDEFSTSCVQMLTFA